MKNIFNSIADFFVKEGLFKIITAFIFLIISIVAFKTDPNSLIIQTILKWIGLISFGYIALTFVIFLIVGIVNAFKKM